MATKRHTAPLSRRPTPAERWVQTGTPPADPAEQVKRLTLDIPRSLHRKLKLQAVREERTILAIAQELFERYLQEHGPDRP